jgi:hypothetical protein
MTIVGDIWEEEFEKFKKEIADLAFDGLGIDGGHHKQWFLERILEKCATEKEILEFKAEYWVEEGVAP